MIHRTATSRNDVSRSVAITTAAVGFFGLVFTGMPKIATATPADAQKAIAALGGSPPVPGKVTILAPDIAENGNTVPIAITVESPMTETDYVKTITIFAEENPQAEVAAFDLSPAMGQAHVELRIRLAQTQHLIAVAQMSDGTSFMATKPVKVTIGGCGG